MQNSMSNQLHLRGLNHVRTEQEKNEITVDACGDRLLSQHDYTGQSGSGDRHIHRSISDSVSTAFFH